MERAKLRHVTSCNYQGGIDKLFACMHVDLKLNVWLVNAVLLQESVNEDAFVCENVDENVCMCLLGDTIPVKFDMKGMVVQPREDDLKE